MARFALVFLGILAVLFTAQLTPPVQRVAVQPWTAAIAVASAGLIQLVDSNVVASGKVLRSTSNGFGVSIEAGCNGVEAALILVAAILAYPAPWPHRVLGIAAGLLAVQVLNIVRVVSLFYVGQWSLAAFEWSHLYLWQALIMLDVLVVWLVWIRAIPVTAPRASTQQP
jgi:exosortase H (IPTLxxWG-CTERM-specific)